MPSKNTELRSLAGRLAAAERWHRPDACELRREFAAARLAAAMRDVDHGALLRLLKALCSDPDTSVDAEGASR